MKKREINVEHPSGRPEGCFRAHKMGAWSTPHKLGLGGYCPKQAHRAVWIAMHIACGYNFINWDVFAEAGSIIENAEVVFNIERVKIIYYW